MSDSLIRAFIPGNFLPNLPISRLTAEELEADPSLGIGVKVTFAFKGVQLACEYKENGLLPDLELLCTIGAGIDGLPLERLKKLGLKVTNTPDVTSDSSADMAMGLLIASARKFKQAFDVARKGSYEDRKAAMYGLSVGFSTDVSSSILGIVGMGSIGYKVAQRAKAFNMKIHYHNRIQRSEEEEAAVGATYHADLTSMLGLCDFVIISCPLTPQTTSLFGKEQFKAMKNTAHLINVARGAIVNTDDLVEALTSKEIHAAALDVTEPEPLPDDHPLLKLDNATITLHCSVSTKQAIERKMKLMMDNAKAFIEGKPLLSEVIL